MQKLCFVVYLKTNVHTQLCNPSSTSHHQAIHPTDLLTYRTLNFPPIDPHFRAIVQEPHKHLSTHFSTQQLVISSSRPARDTFASPSTQQSYLPTQPQNQPINDRPTHMFILATTHLSTHPFAYPIQVSNQQTHTPTHPHFYLPLLSTENMG